MAALVVCSVSAADYPQRPIRMLVPFSPGGTSDTLARILGQKMTEAWGQQVVVDTRPGASGIIGTEIAARAPADGYTLLHGNLSQFATNPFLYSRIPYDTFRDFVALTQVGTAPQLLVITPSLPAKSVGDLVQLAKARPGALNYGSGGAGTLAYLGGEMFRMQAGVNIVHVPYKGTVLALNDLIAGAVQILFSDMPIALPHAKSGKLRAIAVTGAKRTPLYPEMRTVAESGVPGYALDNWWGILAPRATPKEIVAKLAAQIARIHTMLDVRERYAAMGVEALATTPEQFTAYIRSEAAKFEKVIKVSGAKVD
ncbi:MAG TPA: tripartite tricarboxylate transporter substrate binding protein [Burkholderiales bacterium]|nr:tripartite tricarboxylate transporter substrate binding protein [Burkholderiales bacterium]